MTLDQLQTIKLWHIGHRSGHPIEYHAWDVILTSWLMGWMGLPAAALLWEPLAVLACALLLLAPSLYVHWRRTLHLRGRLRCDWLASTGPR